MNNKVKSYFNLPNTLSINLVETEMYDRNYLSIYHSSISQTKEVKWNTKTYFLDNNKMLIRFSFINCFDDNKKILIKNKKYTQIYFQKNVDNINKKVFISKNNCNNKYKNFTTSNISFFVSNNFNEKDLNDQTIELIKYFVENDIDFNIIIDNDKMNVYILEKNNFLFINLEEKFNEEKFKNDLERIYKIIEIL